jgi:hypothetical protein
MTNPTGIEYIPQCKKKVCLLERGLRVRHPEDLNTLRTGDANLRFLRFCITTVKHE